MQLQQYFTYQDKLFEQGEVVDTVAMCSEYSMAGTEVFMEDFASVEKPLFTTEQEKWELVGKLTALSVKRVHCTYWGFPTSFLTKSHFNELVEQIGGREGMIAYYGDMTGDHIFARWAQEYEIACAINAQSYTFHLIDFSVIDGAWAFTISKQEIRQAMVYMTQQLLCVLEQKGLLSEHSPTIELENAGWGLEHGTQVASDYTMLFAQVEDRYNKLKVAWEVNHILHALGCNPSTGDGRFMLPEVEITPDMAWLEASYGNNPSSLAMEWVKHNVLAPELRGKIGSLHLSDCAMKTTEYFRNGILCSPYIEELEALEDIEDKIIYGWKMVLKHYDTHIPLGTGILPAKGMNELIKTVLEQNEGVVLLHELKGSKPLAPALKGQLDYLSISGGQI